MSSIGYALARAELIRALTAYSGITTADGAFDGTATLIDANLIGRNDFISEKTILIMSGDAKDEDKGATAFDKTDGKITLQGTGFSAKIKAGTIFRVLNISSIEIDVANMDAKIDTLLTRLSAARAGYLDELDFDLQGTLAAIAGYIDTEVAALMADVGDASGATLGSILGILGDPAQSFLAMIGYEGATALANKLTAARAALLDEITAGRMSELDAANIPADIDTLLTRLSAARAALIDEITALRMAELDAANIPADIDSLLTRLTAQRALNLDLLDLTTFKQETVAATDVNGTTWKDLLDKSTITKPTKICGFTVTAGGTWAGKAQVRITDGAGTKIFPFQDQYEQDTEFTSGTEVVFNFPVVVPVADGYKFQFRSTDVADGAGETLELNNLDVIEVG